MKLMSLNEANERPLCPNDFLLRHQCSSKLGPPVMEMVKKKPTNYNRVQKKSYGVVLDGPNIPLAMGHSCISTSRSNCSVKYLKVQDREPHLERQDPQNHREPLQHQRMERGGDWLHLRQQTNRFGGVQQRRSPWIQNRHEEPWRVNVNHRPLRRFQEYTFPALNVPFSNPIQEVRSIELSMATSLGGMSRTIAIQ
uniref:Uncharacterized protein n=1 Tax=Ditylenchus dipsaci TaxID=166011 RepID=A0A915E7W0_9BILA